MIRRKNISETKQAQIVELLAVGNCRSAVAKAVGVHRESIRNLMRDPEFEGRVDARRAEYLAEWRARVIKLVPACYAAAKSVLNGNNPAAKAKVLAMIWGSLGVIQKHDDVRIQDIRVELGDHPPAEPPAPLGGDAPEAPPKP